MHCIYRMRWVAGTSRTQDPHMPTPKTEMLAGDSQNGFTTLFAKKFRKQSSHLEPPRRFRQSEEEFPSGTAWHTNLQHPKASSRSTARRGSFLVTISCSTRPHSLGSQRVHARRQPCPQFIRKPIGEAKNRKHTGCGCEVENMPWTYKLIKLTH